VRTVLFVVAFAFAFACAFALTLALGLVFIPLAFALFAAFFALVIRPSLMPDHLDRADVLVGEDSIQDSQILSHMALVRGAGQRDHAHLDREPEHDLLSR